jgi:hypothetical protein
MKIFKLLSQVTLVLYRDIYNCPHLEHRSCLKVRDSYCPHPEHRSGSKSGHFGLFTQRQFQLSSHWGRSWLKVRDSYCPHLEHRSGSKSGHFCLFRQRQFQLSSPWGSKLAQSQRQLLSSPWASKWPKVRSLWSVYTYLDSFSCSHIEVEAGSKSEKVTVLTLSIEVAQSQVCLHRDSFSSPHIEERSWLKVRDPCWRDGYADYTDVKQFLH